MLADARSALRALEPFTELLIMTLRGEEVVYVNHGAQHILGLDGDAIQGTRWIELIHPNDRDRARGSYEIMRARGINLDRVPLRVRRADGTWRLVALRSVAVGDADEVIVVGLDITEGEALRERTVELELTLQQIHAVARVGGWRLDWDTGEVWWSEVTRQICEVDADFTPTLETALLLYPEEVRGTLRAEIARAAETLSQWEVELPFRSMRGTRRRVLSRGVAQRSPSGGVQMIGTIQDITERYELEQRLRRFERTQSLGMLAGGVAHDINNLTGVIMGNAALLLDDAPRPEQLELLADIQAATQHIRQITQQLLGFTGARRAALTAFSLISLLQEIARELRPLLPPQLELPIEVTPPDLLASADRTQLRQMLENLILNATHAGATRVSLRACVHQIDLSAATAAQTPLGTPEADRPWLMIEAHDNGHGMTQEVLERAFDPFFTTRDSGHGLGLATVLGTLQAHQGRLIVTSEPGHGARFVLCLPLPPAPDASEPPA